MSSFSSRTPTHPKGVILLVQTLTRQPDDVILERSLDCFIDTFWASNYIWQLFYNWALSVSLHLRIFAFICNFSRSSSLIEKEVLQCLHKTEILYKSIIFFLQKVFSLKRRIIGWVLSLFLLVYPTGFEILTLFSIWPVMLDYLRLSDFLVVLLLSLSVIIYTT